MLPRWNTHRSWRLSALLFIGLFLAVEAGRKKIKEEMPEEIIIGDDVPEVHYLIEMIGKEIYGMVNRPKYKFYIYMTIGTLPAEQSTIALLNVICNVLYGLIVVSGFLCLPRGFMLFATLTTLYIGPALVLILLGSIGVVLAAFAFYPVYSVVGLWVFFFLTSHLAQTIGRKMGLDSDGDGDIDFLDFLHVVAKTRCGQAMGLLKLHEMLNESAQDPFHAVNQRLNDIQSSTRVLGEKQHQLIEKQGQLIQQQAKQAEAAENGHNRMAGK